VATGWTSEVWRVRKGAEYRRCGSCGRSVRDAKAKDCPNCGGSRITWAFKVDIAPAGAKRQLRSASGFATRREALEAMARLQTDRLDGRYVEPSKITLAEYLDRWWVSGTWEENTKRDYRVSIDRHIAPRIGILRLQDVTTMDIDRLFNALLHGGKTIKGGTASQQAPR
jgi:Phage integrase, N-terminal SAM-like domain